MNHADSIHSIDRTDRRVALIAGIVAFLCYLRTLAPDLLYGDSAEFQAMSYLLGITHSTGYPVYLFLGKILGTLLPVGSFAYRINLLSALYAAGTVSGIYLLGRKLTGSRLGAVMGCLALALSDSFWSQAVIAEVYTLATLVMTWSIYCLWRWQEEPMRREKWALASILLIGLGVHTVAELIVPAAGIFMLVTLWRCRLPARAWGRSIGAAALGGAIGAALFFGTFFLSDTVINPRSSFLNASLIPSSSLWGASKADLDTFPERVYHTVVSLQWRGQLFAGDMQYVENELGAYGDALFERDFSLLVIALAVVGLIVTFLRKPRLAWMSLVGFLTLLVFILNYKVGGKHVYYLASYVFIAPYIGAGAGFLLSSVGALLARDDKRTSYRPEYWLAVALLAVIVAFPAARHTADALAAGKATFYTTDDYTYPLGNLNEPRFAAQQVVAGLPKNAVVLADWRVLYAAVYMASVEGDRQDITFYEACPFPCDGALPDSLIQTINAELAAGKPVFVNEIYKNTREHYRIRAAPGSSKYFQYLPK